MARIAVVIPSYNVRAQILDVISRIGSEVVLVFVVDDCCPEESGQLVKKQCEDPRVKVLFHEQNLGVEGATMTEATLQ